MKRLMLVVLAATLLVPFTLADSLEERVRENASLIYVHGITQELADEQIGVEGVPVLFELLRDPQFERRDNVVAFLGYLASDAQTQKLMDFLETPTVRNNRPEERRAPLLVPDALGNIARRGGMQAQAALNQLREDPTIAVGSPLSRMIDYGMGIAAGTQATDGDTREFYSPDYDAAIDGSALSHRLDLTYANHVDTNSPISDARVDQILADANLVIATETGATDTACCARLERDGDGLVFGTPGDGRDVITSSSVLTNVLSNPISRIKVVDLIQYCGGPGSNIIGCANTPGSGMAVVRLSSISQEGKLWAHELGHNTGQQHNPSGGFIMFATLGSNNVRVSAGECNLYHNPMAPANLTPVSIGSCHDNDGDLIVSSADNCPDDTNSTQIDGDDDGRGNACDNCIFVPNADQADCDFDGIGNLCDAGGGSAPPEVTPVLFSDPNTQNTFSWPFQGVNKRIYRGVTDVGALLDPDVVVIGTALSFLDQWTDSTQPQPDQYLYYLVRGVNNCGEGL